MSLVILHRQKSVWIRVRILSRLFNPEILQIVVMSNFFYVCTGWKCTNWIIFDVTKRSGSKLQAGEMKREHETKMDLKLEFITRNVLEFSIQGRVLWHHRLLF